MDSIMGGLLHVFGGYDGMKPCAGDVFTLDCSDPPNMGASEEEEGEGKPKQDEETLEFDIFYRAKFPGAPFRDYEEDDSTDPVTVIPACTPSVKGVAGSRRIVGSGAFAVAGVAVVVLSSLL